MKILLTTLNSKYIHSNLALRYLYTIVANADLDVDLQEFTINNDKDYPYTEIVRGGYDYIFFSCYIWNIEQIKELAGEVKKACPDTKIIVGGPEVSFDYTNFMLENPWCDFIIKGEGEYPFFQFCKELVLETNKFEKVNNLVFRAGDQIVDNQYGRLPILDRIPFPYSVKEAESDRIIYYESTRGCPYRCSYCLSSVDKEIRSLSMERTRRDLGYFLFKQVKQVKFIDRTFNYDRGRANQIWQYIIDNDNGVTNFHFEICGDLLDNDALRVISKARKGLFQFEVGIQSGNPYTLQAINRKETIFQLFENIEALLSLRNCHVHVDLIAGLPLEDYQSFAQSFNQVYSLGAHNLQLGFLKLLKGTKIREEAAKHGYVFRDKAPYEIISNNYMSATDIVKLKMIETVLELYNNRGGFETILPVLESKVASSSFNLFEQIADFFYSNGYQHRSHKKEDLYRIMFRFAESRENRYPGITQAAIECLAADLEANMNPEAVKKFHKKGWEI